MAKPKRITGRLLSELRTSDEIRDAVYLTEGDELAKQTRFWLLLVLSALIATAGVIGDSTATVIGAMIIAPLAIPIQGVALAITYGESRPLLRSTAILLLAVAVVVGLAAVVSVLLPQLKDDLENSQITGRASPTIVDLLAAAATGLAGAFAVARRDIADILPGVAIAISLVPPLAVVGVTGAAGEFDSALGALVLFLTNVLAIVMAGILVFGATRAVRDPRRDPGFNRRRMLFVVAAGCVVVSGALIAATARTVVLADRLDAATEVASDWAADNGEDVVDSRFDGTTLIVLVEGLGDGGEDAELPRLLDGVVPDGTEVVVNRVAGIRAEVGTVG